MSLFTAGSDGSIRFLVRVTPRARSEGVMGLMNDADGVPTLKLSVNAPAEGGKANRAVLSLLAKELGVTRAALQIQTGAADRRKLIRLQGDNALLLRLNQWAGTLPS